MKTDLCSLTTWLWVFATVGIYFFCYWINLYFYDRFRIPKFTSLYVASIIIAVIVYFCGGNYAQYDASGKVVSWLLYPTTVALAIPLYKNRYEILRNLPEVATATIVSSVVSVCSTCAIAHFTNLDEVLKHSLLSKCVTTPVAIEITKMLGGIEGIAVCSVCITGIIGAFCGHAILNFIGIKRNITIGLAIGSTSHVIGTTRCLEKSQAQAAAGALVLITSALFTAFFISFIF